MRNLVLAVLFAASLAAATDAPATADREYKPENSGRTHVHLGGIIVGGGYSHFSGPGYYPGYRGPFGYGPYGWWDPYYAYWSPFYFHPGYFSGFGYGPDLGEVKLDSAAKEGEVYVDGAYAGKLSKRRSMWLEPGKYNVEVKTSAGSFAKRVYVLSGKTLRLKVEPGMEGRS